MSQRKAAYGKTGVFSRMAAGVLLPVLAAGFGSTAVPAAAQEAIYDGSKARVALAAKLRSLGERATATSCRASTGRDGTASAEQRSVATVFDVVVAGLREGDATLGVPSPEENGRIVRRLDAVEAAWTPVRKAVVSMVDEGAGEAAVVQVAAGHHDLIEAAEVLVTDVSGQYANPQELLQVDAMALNFMERQQMLLARMDRIVCGLHAGLPDLGSTEALAETVSLFDASLIALRDGFPAAGIAAPRTKVLRDTLAQSYEEWSGARALLDRIAADGVASEDDMVTVAALMSDLAGDMDNVITLTKISSPGQEDVYKVPLAAYAESELAGWLSDPALVAAIKAQNAAHAGLTQEQIDALDQTWRAEAQAGSGPLVDDLMSREVSVWLADKQLNSAGFITEAFVMDAKGLNVAQSAVTSDYWQGDEAKWQETYAREGGGLHVSEVEFDDSTGFYQTQASMPIVDPATGEKIGAVTFGINVQRLM
jgi:hypothetical protein